MAMASCIPIATTDPAIETIQLLQIVWELQSFAIARKPVSTGSTSILASNAKWPQSYSIPTAIVAEFQPQRRRRRGERKILYPIDTTQPVDKGWQLVEQPPPSAYCPLWCWFRPSDAGHRQPFLRLHSAGIGLSG